jgi:hypothetical protein
MKRRDGTPYTVTGVSVTHVAEARRAGPVAEPGCGIAGHALVARAADGYRAVFGLAVADPHFGTRLCWSPGPNDDGSPLASPRPGPLQLIHTGEAGPVRWVRQLVAIEVKAL